MPLDTGSIVRFTVNMSLLGQRIANVLDFRITAFAPGTTATQLANAFWADVESTYRALSPASAGSSFDTVVCEELFNAAGALGEYAIPTAERSGTRTNTGGASFMPSFNACSVRLTVGTRLTRPGQKRLPFLTEADVQDNAILSTYLPAATAWAANVTGGIILPAPALGTSLTMVVVGVTPDGFLDSTRVQDVTGFLVNPNVSSQVSRKAGRGQ